MRRLLPLLIVFISAGLSAAETPPRFLIETIRVVGLNRAPERVVISESRLQPGRAYTEAELRTGAARVTRLPYIVRTELRLEKGGERGAYVLVIVATEAKPLFLGSVVRVHNDKSTLGGDNTDVFVTAGSRLLLGRSGVLYGAATTGQENSVDIGYTQYDLFGRGAFLGGFLQYRDRPVVFANVATKDLIAAQIVGAVPLRGNNGLRATWTRSPVAISIRTPTQAYTSDHTTITELAWIHDSTDDPTIPTIGSRIVAAANMRRGPFITTVGRTAVISHYRKPGVSLSGSRLVELRPRHSVGGVATFSRIETVLGRGDQGVPSISRTWIADALYEYTLFQRDLPWRVGDIQLETGLRYYDFENRLDLLSGTRRSGVRTTRALFGLVIRNEWAVIRFDIDLATARDDR